MALTFASLVETLGSLSVSGVTAVSYPPIRMKDDALPIGFPRLPQGEQEAGSFDGIGGIDSITCEYVVWTDKVAQASLPADYAGAVAIMDAVHAALKTEMATNKQIDGWTIRTAIEEMEEAAYWAVIATVRASG